MNSALHTYRSLAQDRLIELRRGTRPKVLATPDNARLHALSGQLVEEAEPLGISRGELVAKPAQVEPGAR